MKKIVLGLVAAFALVSFAAPVFAGEEGGDKPAAEKPAKKGKKAKKDKAAEGDKAAAPEGDKK